MLCNANNINKKKFEVGGKEWSLLEGRALSGTRALNRIIMVHQNRFTQVNSGGLTRTLIELLSISLSLSLSLSLSFSLSLFDPTLTLSVMLKHVLLH